MSRKIILRWKIGKFKDLPRDMKSIFEHPHEDFRTVSYSNGRFHKLIRVKSPFLDRKTGRIKYDGWTEAIAIPLDKDDALVMYDDWSVEGQILGGLFL